MASALVTASGSAESASLEVAKLSEKLAESEARAAQLEQLLAIAQGGEHELGGEIETLRAAKEAATSQVAELEAAKRELIEERDHLEAGLAETINALATASDAEARASLLEEELEAVRGLESGGHDGEHGVATELELLRQELADERDNLNFAQDLLTQSGSQRAMLEAEIQLLKEGGAGGSASALDAACSRATELERLLAISALARASLEEQLGAPAHDVAQCTDAAVLRQALAIAESEAATAAVALSRITDDMVRVLSAVGFPARGVRLKRGDTGLGLELGAGEMGGVPVCEVTAIAPGSAASKLACIELGDVVVAVDGRAVLGEPLAACLAAVRACGGDVALVVVGGQVLAPALNESFGSSTDGGSVDDDVG